MWARLVVAPPIMPGEDFSRYRLADPENIRSLLFWVGGERPETIAAALRDGAVLPSLHSPFWAPQADTVIATATEALTLAALDVLKKG